MAAVFALVRIFRIEEKYAKWITIALIIAVALTLLPFGPVAYDGFYTYILILFICLIYTFTPVLAEPSDQKRIVLSVIFGIPLIAMVLEMNRLPGVVEMGYATILSLGAYLYAVIKTPKQYQNEIGMMTIPAMDAFIRLSILLSSALTA